MSPSGTAAKNRPNISEDTLREVKRLLTGDRQEFKPATFGESLKYNFLGLTPEKEEQSGSFGKALMSETASQFRQLFGIKTTKAERKAEEEAAIEKAQKEAEAAELQKKTTEKNSDNIEAILGEVRTIRKVTEGRVRFSAKSDRYQDAATGKFISAPSVSETSVSGIDVPTDDTQEKILEKLEEIDENTEAGDESILGALSGLGGILTNGFKGLASGISGLIGSLGRGAAALGTGALALGGTAVGAASAGAIAGTVVGGLALGATIGDQFNTSVAEGGSGNFSDWWRNTRLGGLRSESIADREGREQSAARADQIAQSKGYANFSAMQDANRRRAQELQQSSTQAAATTAPVVVNNVDASSKPIVAPQAATGQTVTISLRDTHGSHLRFQESRLTRPM